MSCCPKNSIESPPKHLSNVDRRGKVISIRSKNKPNSEALELYVTGQTDLKKTKRILILFQCIYPFGTCLDFKLSDKFVDFCGGDEVATVLFPDYFRGDAPMDPSLPSDIGKPLAFEKIKNKFGSKYFDMTIHHTLLPWLRESGASLDEIGISCLGFCFGAWVAAKCLASSNIIRCGIGFHPSLQIETMIGDGTIEEVCESIKDKPFFMMPAGNDMDIIKPGGTIVEMFAKARNVNEEDVSVSFEDMIHGFAIRGDSNDKKVKVAQEKSYDLAVSFISKHHPVS